MADNLDEAFPSDPDLPIGEVTTAEVQPAPQPEVPVEPQEPVPSAPLPEPVVELKQEHAIPIATALQWRDGEREWKRKFEQLEAQRRQQPQEHPDPLDDPSGFRADLTSQFTSALQEQKIGMSWELAKGTYGEETAEKARDWAVQKADSDPVFRASLDQAMNAQLHPIDWVVRQHKREEDFSALGGRSLNEYIEAEIAKRGYVLPTATAPAAPVVATVPPASPPARVPRSLASQGSEGSDIRHVATGPLAGVDAVFS